jgi:hypothetical protein
MLRSVPVSSVKPVELTIASNHPFTLLFFFLKSISEIYIYCRILEFLRAREFASVAIFSELDFIELVFAARAEWESNQGLKFKNIISVMNDIAC